VHGGATQSAPHLSLRTRKKWHHDKGNAGQKDARNAVLRGSLGPQVRRRFVGDVGGEAQETHADNLQGSPFVAFAAVLIRINRHPPQQSRTGGHFDEAVDAKPDKGYTPGHGARDNRHQPFQGIPRDGEVFEPPPRRTTTGRSKMVVSTIQAVYNFVEP